MAMTKTEATYLNVLLNWLMNREGPRGVPDLDEAGWAAGKLAASAYKTLTAGVGPGTVEDFFTEHNPRVLPGGQLAPEVAQLLAGWWTLEAAGGGSVNGGDAVTFVEEWLTKTCGANATHPVVRAQNGPDGYVPTEGMDEWDEVHDLLPFAREHGRDEFVPVVCDRCGGPIRDPENAPVEFPICRDCAGSEAVG